MRLGTMLIVLLALTVCPVKADGVRAKIYKVLPHLLDQDGKHTLSPSLFERDAYQVYLREHPEEVSGLRYDIEWKARGVDSENLKLKLEVRTGKGKEIQVLVLSEAVTKKKFRFRQWSSLEVDSKTFHQSGVVIAWRATLWAGDSQIAEHKSFLW